jgi:spermidine/putrescine ABC transporter ATP-binding subunit
MDSQLYLSNVSKFFNIVKAVDNLSLSIKKGEFLTLLGPSGSGKTTTLNMIAGFETPNSGNILLENQDITTMPPNKRGIGMVFQNYALFPHMTVFQNIAFPLKMRKIPYDTICEKTKRVLELVKLSGFELRYPNQLSGGQQQRIALARTIVFQPKILLMDEPLGALDKKLRDRMRLEIKHIQESLNITVVYVTHDQEEALTMSDRIAIMNNGRIIQLDTPFNLYENPLSRFVADFIGESNFFEGSVKESNENFALIETKEGLSIKVDRKSKLSIGEEISVAVRPEKIMIISNKTAIDNDMENIFEGRLKEIVYIGEAISYRIELSKDLIINVKVQNISNAERYSIGDNIKICFKTYNGLAT